MVVVVVVVVLVGVVGVVGVVGAVVVEVVRGGAYMGAVVTKRCEVEMGGVEWCQVSSGGR